MTRHGLVLSWIRNRRETLQSYFFICKVNEYYEEEGAARLRTSLRGAMVEFDRPGGAEPRSYGEFWAVEWEGVRYGAQPYKAQLRHGPFR